MIKYIDGFLNKITMYRLTIYCLIFLLLVALVLSFFGKLPFTPANLVFSTAFILIACLLTNQIFAVAFGAPSNIESVYITALILALIITPAHAVSDFWLLLWAGVLAMASKYIVAIKKKHIFNPAAFAVVVTFLALNQSASWWVGNIYMFVFVFAIGFLITRKIKRADLVISFFVMATAAILGYKFFIGQSVLKGIQFILTESAAPFLAFVMLTEPATTPPIRSLRIVYGAIAGFLFAPFITFYNFYFTPELALLAGNIFSYLVSPKEKLILVLKEKIKSAENVYDFVFNSAPRLSFVPGQYMEWTLGHEKPDDRGIRRYFTIASSPTENEMRIGVKFYPKPSTYKKKLESIKAGDEIVAAQRAGDFTLLKDKSKKLAFIAGGIGVTPFRSMIKYLLDKNEMRDIIMFYSNKTFAEIAYKDIFDKAGEILKIKTVYTLSDAAPAGWAGEKGFVNEEMIKKYAPDFKERTFYISGPKSMIDAFEGTLQKMGVPKMQIKTDFFPGFA